MMMETSEQECLTEITELLMWGNNINISEIYELSVLDFYILRKMFREKYLQDMDSKQKLEETRFKFLKTAVEAICKTIGSAFGGSKNSGSKNLK